MEPELTIIALSLWIIGLLAVICVIYPLVSIWKENRFGWPVSGIIWFSLTIIGCCAIIGLLAGSYQQNRSLEKISHSGEAVTFGVE